MSTFAHAYLPWLMSAITLYMTYLQGDKKTRSWIVGLVNQFLWLVFAIGTQTWGLLPLNAGLWILYIRNFRKWREGERQTRLLDCTHPAFYDNGVCSCCKEFYSANRDKEASAQYTGPCCKDSDSNGLPTTLTCNKRCWRRPKPSAHPPYITVTSGLSGYFAVMLAWNPDLGGFYEPWETGVGRYRTAGEAEKEARAWADDEGVEYRP